MVDLNNAPEQVLVVFPRVDAGTMLETGVYTIPVEQFTGSSAFDTKRVKIIKSTAVAFFPAGSIAPINLAELTALADRIAFDFYNWRLGSVEIRYESVVDWDADGLHDIEYQHINSISTFVHRSMWEPDFGELRQTGTYTSSDTAICIAIRDICTGIILYMRYVRGVLVSVNGDPCPDCIPTPASGSGAASGSGVVIQTSCCPDPLPQKLCLVVSNDMLAGSYNLAWDIVKKQWEQVDAIGTCNTGSVSFACNDAGQTIFALTVNGTVYYADSAQCNPIGAAFTNVNLSGCGGGATATITIATGPCGAGHGSANCPACCPSDLIPKTLCLSVTGAFTATATLTNDGSLGGCTWIGTLTACGTTDPFVQFTCSGPTWHLTSALFSVAINGSACNPFVWQSTGTTVPPCPVGAVTATVTADMTACGGSSGGATNVIASKCCPDDLLPATLHAAFGGVLSSVGTIQLTWDVDLQRYAAYAVEANCGGTNVFFHIYFYCNVDIHTNTAVWILLIPEFLIELGQFAASCNPLLWNGSGDVPGGACVGAFSVTVSP